MEQPVARWQIPAHRLQILLQRPRKVRVRLYFAAEANTQKEHLVTLVCRALWEKSTYLLPRMPRTLDPTRVKLAPLAKHLLLAQTIRPIAATSQLPRPLTHLLLSASP
jgi:hypothetical protein